MTTLSVKSYRERPITSGRSQASLTTYNATAGGKNRPAAGSFFVIQPREARGRKAQCPLADMPLASLHLSGGGCKGGAGGQQQHGTRPFSQSDRGLLFPKPPRQGGTRVVIHLHMDRCVASLPLSPPSVNVVQES